MPNPSPLKVFTCIAREETRQRCLKLFEEIQGNGKLAELIPWYKFELLVNPTAEQLFDQLRLHFQTERNQEALLLSDRLVEPTGICPPEEYQPTAWAKEVFITFENKSLGTIAIMERYQRVPDIDHVLWRDSDSNGLLETLQLSAERLLYIRPPVPQPLRRPVVVRLISKEIELEQYFRLRHRAYRVMGYLNQKVELASSRMEIDSCDPTALHIGAFEQSGAREELVGTARLVSVDPLDHRFETWTRALAIGDAVLKSVLKRGPLQLGLPIFHSMNLKKEKWGQLLTKDKCGELSRVIVKDVYRGTGLSKVLARFAILTAIEQGITRLFLECLPLHQDLYHQLGFEKIEGATGRVIGVDRTMIAMELAPQALTDYQQAKTVPSLRRIISDKRHLCACPHHHCYRGTYENYGQETCPLR